MKIRTPIVLFFLLGMVPTDEQLKEGLRAHAKFRNVELDDGKREPCDFVMGEVPEQYLEEFNDGERVLPAIPMYSEDAAVSSADPTAGEQVGDHFLHQIGRGQYNVKTEDGELLNTDGPLKKADARALALANTEEK